MSRKRKRFDVIGLGWFANPPSLAYLEKMLSDKEHIVVLGEGMPKFKFIDVCRRYAYILQKDFRVLVKDAECLELIREYVNTKRRDYIRMMSIMATPREDLDHEGYLLSIPPNFNWECVTEYARNKDYENLELATPTGRRPITEKMRDCIFHFCDAWRRATVYARAVELVEGMQSDEPPSYNDLLRTIRGYEEFKS